MSFVRCFLCSYFPYKANENFSSFIIVEKTRTSPYLEKGEVKNRTAVIGQNVSIPCFELISGTLPDFRWLKWKTTPNVTVLDMVAQDTKEYSKDILEIMKADQYKQVSKQSHRSKAHNPLYGIELVLHNVTESDQGFYTCLVSNHIGHDFVTMYLTVKDCKSFNLVPVENDTSR